MRLYSLYLHIPFCSHRCAYCDFNTYAGLDFLIPEYVEAMCREIEYLSDSQETHSIVHTIFFGGGTPSLLPIKELERVFLAIYRHFNMQKDIEITLEANPGTLSQEYLNGLKQLGVNRLSLGMQSADLRELKLLERAHDFGDVIQAVDWARRAGITNLSLDLIFGLPDQNLSEWMRNLSLAVQLLPDHLSLYALTLEHGTPMEYWVKRGLVPQPDPDLAAEMYEFSMDYLGREGFVQYEISNWAREGKNGQIKSCRHNMQYWRNRPYLGIGAGAHGYANQVRTANVLAPSTYIQRNLDQSDEHKYPFPRTSATANIQPIEKKDEMAETMIMGLRLTQEGVSKVSFFQRFERDLEDEYGNEIQELLQLGLLEWAGDSNDILRLTPNGRLLGNQAFIRFI